jgi:Holliday junction resolvase RusA-like endonuclease
MTLQFTIPGCPVAKGRPKISTRGGHARAYTPAKTRAAEETLAARAIQFRPKEPLACPLILTARFIMPIPSSMRRRDREIAAVDALPHTTRPDLDNLIKLLKDALSGAFFLDDKQIYEVRATKHYGPFPRTEVTIEYAAEGYNAA